MALAFCISNEKNGLLFVEILKVTKTIVSEALLRIQTPAQTDPPAYVPFLRKVLLSCSVNLYKHSVSIS